MKNERHEVTKSRLFGFFHNGILIGAFYILGIIVISAVTLWPAFHFDFWRDEWMHWWFIKYDPHFLRDLSQQAQFHRIEFYIQAVFFPLFKLHPLYWRLLGFFMRVVGALSVAVMMLGVTKRKKLALIAGVIFAGFPGGLETVTWQSADSAAIVLILLCIGLYFWSKEYSYKEKIKSYLFYFIGALFFLAAVWSDTGRGSMVLVIAFFYDLLSLMQKFSFKQTLFVLTKVMLLVGLFAGLLLFAGQQKISVSSTLLTNLKDISLQHSLLKTFITSIGNLLIGWIYPIQETDSLTNPHAIPYYAGFIFLLAIPSITVIYLFTRKNYLKPILIFMYWIPLFYLLNWFFEKDIILGITHRYLAISSVGAVCLLAYLLGNLKFRYAALLTLIVIAASAITSLRILGGDLRYRSVSVIEPMWNEIDKDVPRNETNSVFMFLGDNYIKGAAFDWVGAAPFALRRNISTAYDFPIVTQNEKLLADLICKNNIFRPGPYQEYRQKSKIPLSHIHAWRINDNATVTDISKQKRDEIKNQLKCLPKT